VVAFLVSDAARDLYRFKPIGFVYLVAIVLALGVAWQIFLIVDESLDRRREERRVREAESQGRFRLP
jgi:hypothetical protein